MYRSASALMRYRSPPHSRSSPPAWACWVVRLAQEAESDSLDIFTVADEGRHAGGLFLFTKSTAF